MVTKTDYGFIRSTQIVDEMRSSYLDYSMSVIVSRALPDVRDGLKPVQRRILFAMSDPAIRPSAAFEWSRRDFLAVAGLGVCTLGGCGVAPSGSTETRLLKAALNGGRQPGSHPALPV